MRRSLISPTALGGYGAIILTVVIFFSQGGFGEMTSLTYLYIIGFVVGIGLVIFSLIKVNGGKDKISKKGLNSIVPTLEKMDSLLREQAKKEAKTPIDLQGYTNFNAKINAEIFGIKPVTDIEPQSMRRLAQREAIRMIQKYGNKKDKWFQQAKTLSGAYDINGYGLKVFRDRGRYKKLLRMLTTNRNYVTDELLNTLIKKHIELSETLNNMLLLEERAVSIKANYDTKQYSIKDFVSSSIIGGLGNLERDISESMIDTRVEIGKRIKELEDENVPKDKLN